MEYNIYCDESCHLEHDDSNAMSLGAIWLPKKKIAEVNQDIKAIKIEHGLSSYCETKWTKISPSKETLYLELIDYFFSNDNLFFRGLVVPDKSILRHEDYNQTHNDWYDKMYFAMLKKIIKPCNEYYIYPDIKDTHSYYRSKQLQQYLCNKIHDFNHKRIKRIQPIQSREVQIMQLVDILTGAIAYANRQFEDDHNRSSAKLSVVKRIETHNKRELKRSSQYMNQKFNLLIWDPSKGANNV